LSRVTTDGKSSNHLQSVYEVLVVNHSKAPRTSWRRVRL